MPRRASRGFTLIEIMVVVVIIGILATLVIANVGWQGDKARVNTTFAMLQEVSTQIELFKLDHSRFPDKLEDLFQQPAGVEPGKWKAYLKRKPLDAWGNEFVYRADAGTGEYDLHSTGADGKEGGDGLAKDISHKDQPTK